MEVIISMSINGNTTKILLEEVTKNVELFGDKKTTEILRNHRENNLKTNHIEFVLNMVSEKFKLTPEKIIESKSKNKTRVMAMGCICYYTSKHFKGIVLQSDVAKRLKRDNALVLQYTNKIKEKRKDKKDEYHQTVFKEFDFTISRYLKDIKTVWFEKSLQHSNNSTK